MIQLLSENQFLITVTQNPFISFPKNLCNRTDTQNHFPETLQTVFLKRQNNIVKFKNKIKFKKKKKKQKKKRQNKKLVLWPNLVEELNPRNETVYVFVIFHAANTPSMSSSLTMTFWSESPRVEQVMGRMAYHFPSFVRRTSANASC